MRWKLDFCIRPLYDELLSYTTPGLRFHMRSIAIIVNSAIPPKYNPPKMKNKTNI